MLSRLPLWSKGLILGTLMAFVLAACGGDEATSTPTVSSATQTPTATLAPGQTPTATPETPATSTPDSSFDAEAYFKGKTIRIVANSNPGGGTDAQGRVMSAFLKDWIPGNPNIVFQNNGNKPHEYVYAATEAPKDGTYISWNSTPQIDFGFNENGAFIKRSTFEFIGATIDATRSFTTYDPVGNLGPEAANKCLWDFNTDNTGAGRHGEFRIGEEISDIAEGTSNMLATVYAMEQVGAPFKYYAFDVMDTNAVLTKWQQNELNTTVRSSLWYRIPNEFPDWLPDGTLRVFANMGPGTLNANSWGEPHCGYIGDHLPNDEAKKVYKAIMDPPNYMSKSLWLPPGTPDEVADALHDAFQRAFTEDPELVQKYSAIAGEEPKWTTREEGTQATIENEAIFEESVAIVERERERILQTYFPEYISN